MNKIKVKRTDKKDVVDILCRSFANDPHISYIVGQNGHYHKRYKRLMSYAFEQAFVNGSIELAEDRKAVAVWRNHGSKKMTPRLLLENTLFLLDYGVSGIKRIAEMEDLVQKAYPQNKEFLYLWFIGTLPEAQGTGKGSALLNPVLERCLLEGTDVYLETSTPQNVSYYLKKGFEMYGKVQLGIASQLQIFLMKKSVIP